MLFDRAPAHPQFLVLLVEDFRPLRLAIHSLLESSRYHVLSAWAPEEALRIAGNSAIPFDLLITRLTPSGITGPELASQIPNRAARFSVLYMSDDSARSVQQLFSEEVRSCLLPHPFDEETLLARVKNALEPGDSRIGESRQQSTLESKSVQTSQKRLYSAGPQHSTFLRFR
jgi:DNA-binding response OmpR family regulator